jgi:hypothetical protein
MRPTPFAVALLAVVALSAAPACAAARPGSPARWGPWSVELVDDTGAVLPTFEHGGRTYVLGSKGRRYAVRVHNGTAGRVEVVVSVDGRDAIDGRPSSFGKRGYVVDPWSEAVIDGFRLSDASVAAFRFGSVASSYAARMGDARDVGAIGVAVFPEEPPRWTQRPRELAGRERLPDALGAERDSAPSAPSAPPASSAPALRGEAQAKAAPQRAPAPDHRPGLGTDFGEERESAVARVAFERARSEPDAVLTVRYDDRAGLLALGIDVAGSGSARRDEAWRRERADPFRREASYSAPPPGWRP